MKKAEWQTKVQAIENLLDIKISNSIDFSRRNFILWDFAPKSNEEALLLKSVERTALEYKLFRVEKNGGNGYAFLPY